MGLRSLLLFRPDLLAELCPGRNGRTAGASHVEHQVWEQRGRAVGDYLRENFSNRGGRLTLDEIMQQGTGESLTDKYLLQSLTDYERKFPPSQIPISRASIQLCKISVAAIRSTAAPRFFIETSASRMSRLA